MDCFSIDESGYTGFDLLNAQQRFQGAIAVSIPPDAAARLIKERFPKLQTAELKYSQLTRRPGNRARLLALQRDLLAQYPCVTCVADKRYLLLLLFVDFAVEPAYHAVGMDFYYTGRQLLGAAPFDALLAAFQRAVKEKTPQAVAALVQAARATHWRELPEALGPLVDGAPMCLAAIAQPGVRTDAAFILLQALITRTEVMSGGPYRIEHDPSTNLLTYSAILQRFIGHTQRAEFQHTQITRLSFPLKLTAVTQVDSMDNPAVQLADVLVGAAIEAARGLGTPEGTAGASEVFKQYGHDQFIYFLPELDFAQNKRFRQGTQANEFIDYFAQNFAQD